jgi:hypothetical protein
MEALKVKKEGVVIKKETSFKEENKENSERPSSLAFDAIDARYLFFEMVMGTIHSQMKRSYCKFKPIRAKVVLPKSFFLLAFGDLRFVFEDASEIIPRHWQTKQFPSCEGETIIGTITKVFKPPHST